MGAPYDAGIASAPARQRAIISGMALGLLDQYQQAVREDGFRHKVAAADFDEARAQLGKTALPDPTQEQQRKNLISGIFHDVAYALDLFAWAVVSDTSVTSVADLDDTHIRAVVTSVFNPVAQQFPL